MEETKMIRFISSDYKTLFRIPDGEKIVLTYPEGEPLIRPCKFLDEYHTQVGNSVFHICEFAELMERRQAAYTPEKPQPLPKRCFALHPQTNGIILIEQGKEGYSARGSSTENARYNRKIVSQRNDDLGVTDQQAAAMLGGCLFGWDTPAAQVTSYDMKGNPLPILETRQEPEKTKNPQKSTAKGRNPSVKKQLTDTPVKAGQKNPKPKDRDAR